MESIDQARQVILKELLSDDADVRREYLHLYEPDVMKFADAMATTVIAWRSVDALVGKDERRGYVSALVYAAFTLHIISMKLFLSGHIVPAGNAMRQVIETIALALLCAGKDIGVLERFMEDKYSTNDAVRDVLRQGDRLGLKQDGLAVLKTSQEFYHQYSHISRLTLATMISFSEDGTYVGASFDAGKVDAYRKEVDARLSLALVFQNFVEAVKVNLTKW